MDEAMDEGDMGGAGEGSVMDAGGGGADDAGEL
jgi:hypothetical protein